MTDSIHFRAFVMMILNFLFIATLSRGQSKDAHPAVPIPANEALMLRTKQVKAQRAEAAYEAILNLPQILQARQKKNQSEKEFTEAAQAVAEKICGKGGRLDEIVSGEEDPKLVCYLAPAPPKNEAAK